MRKPPWWHGVAGERSGAPGSRACRCTPAGRRPGCSAAWSGSRARSWRTWSPSTAPRRCCAGCPTRSGSRRSAACSASTGTRAASPPRCAARSRRRCAAARRTSACTSPAARAAPRARRRREITAACEALSREPDAAGRGEQARRQGRQHRGAGRPSALPPQLRVHAGGQLVRGAAGHVGRHAHGAPLPLAERRPRELRRRAARRGLLRCARRAAEHGRERERRGARRRDRARRAAAATSCSRCSSGCRACSCPPATRSRSPTSIPAACTRSCSGPTSSRPRISRACSGPRGSGPKSLRALALTAEVIYGTAASTRDPARFAFAHGGKDGTPHPVDRATYEYDDRRAAPAL